MMVGHMDNHPDTLGKVYIALGNSTHAIVNRLAAVALAVSELAAPSDSAAGHAWDVRAD
jgi:hypothetical protein